MVSGIEAMLPLVVLSFAVPRKSALTIIVIVLEEDMVLVDILALLTPPHYNVVFLKHDRENIMFPSKQFEQPPFCESLLFIHSFSGSDTSSAIYSKMIIL